MGKNTKKRQPRLTPEERRAKMEAVAARLEAGVEKILDSEEFKRYLAFVGRFHDYSANNVMLILMQRPDATMVAGYRAWQRMGRQVRRGEKGIVILAPKKWKQTVEDEETGEKVVVASGMRGCTTASVFDISQTDGEPLPERPSAKMLTGESTEGMALFQLLMGYVLDEGIEIDFAGADRLGGAKGLYTRPTKATPARITLLEGMAADQTTKTLLHEIVHHELHKDAHFGSEARASKEVEAEGTAFVVLQHYGVDSSDYSFADVAGWAADKRTYTAALKTIQRTADALIGRFEVRRDGTGRPVEDEGDGAAA